jgi:hypothetical protein
MFEIIGKATIVGPAALALLRARLAAHTDPLAREQRAAWREIAKALTASQVDEIIRVGALTPAAQATLAAGVAEFVEGPLSERWRSTLLAGGRALDTSLDLLSRARVDAWIAQRGAELIAQQTEHQREAVRVLLQGSREMDRGTLSQALRATTGMTPRQARSLAALNAALVEDDVSPAARRQALERAAQRAQRMRARVIARTELASAFNGGVEEAINSGLDAGAFSEAEKEWRMQRDERTRCDVCKELDKETVPVGTPFSAGIMAPPAHPNCRCVLLYEVK